MRPILILAFFLLFSTTIFAGRISGIVTDEKGSPLPYASVMVKGSPKGTTANNEGRYFIELPSGSFVLVAQYVGYAQQDKSITITDQPDIVNFQLSLQQLSLAEVVVRPGAEDPAYEIIRNAIKKRPYYLNQLDKFQCEVYIKGQLQLRNYPKKILGQTVDFEDGDTSKKKMVYLSETVATYSVQKPNKTKIEVLSTKVSGERDGFGLSQPQIVSFYENNISIGRNLNARGFVSPIANGAIHFYKYKYEGSFYEDGKEINKIRVIPRRKYEPLFSGTINIIEGDWRIHSLQLQLLKESQMQFLDTLRIEQLYVPLEKDVWVIKSQVVYPAAKFFGFDGYGSFVNIYSKFDVNPPFEPGFFNNTFLKFYDSSNKKSAQYWDTIRPLPLQTEEITDYRKKDSLEQARKDPRYLDSLDRKRNKISIGGILLFGENFSRAKKREFYSINPLIQSVGYNTVEGWNLNLRGSYSKRLDTTNGRNNIFISPWLRYGFSNHHFNASVSAGYNYGKKYRSFAGVSFGKRTYQFNNQNPITSFDNTITTLFFERNYMKLYEAWFGRVNFSKGLGGGVNISGGINWQDRLPLENSTEWTIKDYKRKVFSPNFPIELSPNNFKRHQAFIINAGISWRPGTRYIEYPERTVNVGSRYPTFTLNYTQAINNIFGADLSYAKYRFGVSDALNLKLGGTFRYNFSAGGFLFKDSVELPDYTHFSGNQILLATDYLSGFQLLPYYKYSNTKSFYLEGHAEHHFNGLLTNKIPLFRKLNWHLVGGANSFYLDKNQHYTEVFVGFENIFRIIRFDWIWSFEKGHPANTGFRISIGGLSRGGSGD
ncbi:MAG: carboxypeptidase-like regulatory domain-containing protein [Gemmatimonadaceae bacterium]|nr:carboxypeptidase-like regulatory domain-containing protein [Chitinophagaceae bacterium]